MGERELERKYDVMEAVLGKPAGFDISEAAAKIRRNLILVSSVILALVFGGVESKPDFIIFGVSLVGVTSVKLMLGLFLVLIYTVLHYAWYVYELYSEWSVRLTGTNFAFNDVPRTRPDNSDYPVDPKQSSIYSWWIQEVSSYGAYSELLHAVEKYIEETRSRLNEIESGSNNSLDFTIVHQSVGGLENTLSQVRYVLSSNEKLFLSDRIPVSLGRFDRRFRSLLRSQNLRVVLVEVALPFALALCALFSLVKFFNVCGVLATQLG